MDELASSHAHMIWKEEVWILVGFVVLFCCVCVLLLLGLVLFVRFWFGGGSSVFFFFKAQTLKEELGLKYRHGLK